FSKSARESAHFAALCFFNPSCIASFASLLGSFGRAANPSVAGSTSSFGGSADADGSAFTSRGGSHLLGVDLRHAQHAATTSEPTASERIMREKRRIARPDSI